MREQIEDRAAEPQVDVSVPPQSTRSTPPVLPTVKTKAPKSFLLMMVLVVALIGGLLVSGVLPRLAQHKELDKEQAAITGGMLNLQVTTAQPAPKQEELTLPANIQPVQEIPLYARCDGYLKEQLVDIGDRVKTGQLLMIIDTPELEKQLKQAKAGLTQSHSQLRSAEADLAQSMATLINNQANVKKGLAQLAYSQAEVVRYQKLATDGAVSWEQRDEKRRDVDSDVATLDSYRAAVAAAQSQVDSYRERVGVAKANVDSNKANWERLHATVDFQKVLAPCDGVITARNVDSGALVSSGSSKNNQELLRLAKTDVLRIYALVPQSFFEYVHVGMPASITVAELPKQEFIGKIYKVAGGLDAASRTLQIEIRIPNKDGKLLPGLYAQAKLTAPRAADPPLIIPSSALVVRQDGVYVAVVDKSDMVHYHKLEMGRDYGHNIEVVKGLNAGDRIAIDPPVDLADGTKVKPVLKPAADK